MGKHTILEQVKHVFRMRESLMEHPLDETERLLERLCNAFNPWGDEILQGVSLLRQDPLGKYLYSFVPSSVNGLIAQMRLNPCLKAEVAPLVAALACQLLKDISC